MSLKKILNNLTEEQMDQVVETNLEAAGGRRGGGSSSSPAGSKRRAGIRKVRVARKKRRGKARPQRGGNGHGRGNGGSISVDLSVRGGGRTTMRKGKGWVSIDNSFSH